MLQVCFVVVPLQRELRLACTQVSDGCVRQARRSTAFTASIIDDRLTAGQGFAPGLQVQAGARTQRVRSLCVVLACCVQLSRGMAS